MYLLSLLLISSLVTASILTADDACDIGGITCECWETGYGHSLKCTLRKLSDLDKISHYIKEKSVTFLSIRVAGVLTFPSSALPSHNFTKLFIDGDDLVDVDDDAFVGLENSLRTLGLRDGHFKKIPISAISRLRVLRNLGMRGNRITCLDQCMRTLPITGLYLGNNQISRIEEGILPSSLRVLHLFKNNLRSLNGALSGNITYLDVSDNCIESLVGELDRMPYLETLKARSNRIVSLGAETFVNVNRLKHLVLSNNRISSLGRLKGLHDLRALDLSMNELTDVSREAFVDLRGLLMLNISSNRLYTLPEGTMDYMTSLEWLGISSNVLRDLSFLLRSDLEEKRSLSIAVTGLKYLRMKDSGIKYDEENNKIINSLLDSTVDIEGIPCTRYR